MSTENNDKLDLLIAFSASNCGNDDVEMFRNLDTSGVILSSDFYAKQRRLVGRYKRKPKLALLRKCLMRVAVVLLVIMSVGFLTLMAIPNLRNAIFEAVIEWYDDYISIRFEPSGGENFNGTDTSSETSGETGNSNIEITPPTKIERVIKPTYIPNGAEEEIVKNSQSGVVIDYYLGDDLILSFTQTIYKRKEMLFDNNVNASCEVEVNGFKAVLLDSEANGKTIIWTDGVYYYSAYSLSLDAEEMVSIASSVQ